MRVRVIISWLEHDGRRRAIGELLDLEDAAAAQLLALGAVEPAPEAERRAESKAASEHRVPRRRTG